MKYYVVIFILLFISVSSCEEQREDAAYGDSYLFLSETGLTGGLQSGDVIRFREEELSLRNPLTGRDTTIPVSAARNVIRVESDGTITLSGGDAAQQRLVALQPTEQRLDTQFLTRQPFLYRYLDQEYWASFEPSFTGFPEYARPGARDFVNRLTDWSATAPGLEYSEYTLVNDYVQPILILSERDRGQYEDNQVIIIDSIGSDAFRGRILRANGESVPITFKATETTAGASSQTFVEEVNTGYSRSYLLLKRNRKGSAASADTKRLPRRSYIDPGDLGAISASFLDDGTVMFLSDDHIVLQGSYVLDFDKGLLTLTDDTGASYRVFIDTEGGITFTLPVTVVELGGGRLVGEDNYLRIEVVGG
ncbi:hypothetical protein CLV84_2651 [Neolewinella xylanilytica]|uniref:Uncharacterized protein n=1 Tax=Neolewinella xylanilytica TaxID=1514080 RepID=A0A2S6I3J8_9BACT|nr:hypothetical protein [Neolewinella xylanilytica]PPK85747.1 hypothetical protein CLV84_2651 [Neolewinella xylanilytica]